MEVTPEWSKEGLPVCHTGCPLLVQDFGCTAEEGKIASASVCEPKVLELVRELKILKANPKGVVLLEEDATLQNALVINCEIKVKHSGGNTFVGNKMAGSTVVHEVPPEKIHVVKELAAALQTKNCIACKYYRVDSEICAPCAIGMHKRFVPIPIAKLDEFEKRLKDAKE